MTAIVETTTTTVNTVTTTIQTMTTTDETKTTTVAVTRMSIEPSTTTVPAIITVAEGPSKFRGGVGVLPSTPHLPLPRVHCHDRRRQHGTVAGGRGKCERDRGVGVSPATLACSAAGGASHGSSRHRTPHLGEGTLSIGEEIRSSSVPAPASAAAVAAPAAGDEPRAVSGSGGATACLVPWRTPGGGASRVVLGMQLHPM